MVGERPTSLPGDDMKPAWRVACVAYRKGASVGGTRSARLAGNQGCHSGFAPLGRASAVLGAMAGAGERDVERLATAAAAHAKGPKGEDGAS